MYVPMRQKVLCVFSDPVSLVWRLAAETGWGLSESSTAWTQAGSQTQGVVSLAHSLLFGYHWQQDPNNLDMWLYKKNLGMEPKVGIWGHSVGGRAAVSSRQLLIYFPSFFLSKLHLGCLIIMYVDSLK